MSARLIESQRKWLTLGVQCIEGKIRQRLTLNVCLKRVDCINGRSRTCRWLKAVNIVSPKVEIVRQATSVISNHVAFICVRYWVICCTLHLCLGNLPETCYRFLLPLPAGYIFCSFFYGLGNLQDVVFAACLGMGLTKTVYPTFYMIPGPAWYAL